MKSPYDCCLSPVEWRQRFLPLEAWAFIAITARSRHALYVSGVFILVGLHRKCSLNGI
jgi:hypothetical protein